MRYGWRGISALALIAFAGGYARAQAVISAHSGVVNFTEGTVLIDDQPLVPKAGTFTSVHENSTLRTEKGRAEILLTPGVFLRLDENSAIRMISTALDNTRVEFLNGAAILDSNRAEQGSGSLALVYKGFEIRFRKNGVYRVDSEPAVFETYVGEAEIRSAGEAPKTIDESRQFFFNIGMETNKYGDGAVDTFSEWARNRAETIEADNRAAAQSTADPTLPDPSVALGVVPPMYPTYSTPGTGIYAPPLIFDNGFYGPFGPVTNLFPANPFTVIYVFPRIYAKGYPVRTPSPPRISSGYPVLASSPVHYPQPAPHHPVPLSYRPLSPAHGYTPVRLPAVRSYAPPSRITGPAMVSHPAMAAPVHHR